MAKKKCTQFVGLVMNAEGGIKKVILSQDALTAYRGKLKPGESLVPARLVWTGDTK